MRPLMAAAFLSLLLHASALYFLVTRYAQHTPAQEPVLPQQEQSLTTLVLQISSAKIPPTQPAPLTLTQDLADAGQPPATPAAPDAAAADSPKQSDRQSAATNIASSTDSPEPKLSEFNPRTLLQDAAWATSEPGTEAMPHHLPDAWDPDHASGEQAIRSMASVLPFARELQMFLTIPYELRALEAKGFAEARIRQRNQHYQVTRVDGDPYFRALLHETLVSFLKDEVRQIELSRLDGQPLRVRLRWQRLIDRPGLTLPDDLVINGFTVTLNYHQVITPEYARNWLQTNESESGHAAVGINLLGPLFMAYQHFSQPDYEASVVIRRLKQSPAFRQPLK